MTDVTKNTHLIVKTGVRLTDDIVPVIVAMDEYFKEANLTAYVTSGERNSQDQLDIIRMYTKRYAVDEEFPEIKTCNVSQKIDFGEGKKIFTWQRAWSRLLNKNIIVNPPFPATVLFDYFRNGVNKKGQEIGYSPHYYGKAFDIGGGIDHDIVNELAVVEKAVKEKKIPGMKGFLAERNNNCVHIDCF